MKRFQEIRELPPIVRTQVENYRTATELAAAYTKNQAVFHKTCMTRYDKQKFERKVKQNKPDDTLTEIPRTSRRTISANKYSEKRLFYDKLETCHTLHSCQTLYLDNSICKIVHNLAKTKLLAKLNEGDTIDTKAKYHRKCLVYFYNHYHNHNVRKSEETRNLEVIQGKFYFSVVRINRWNY